MSKYLEFPAVDKFDKLSYKSASTILYDSLVPFCEKKGVFLSTYGNHNAPRAMLTVKDYYKSRKRKQLFHVKDVQRAFHYVGKIFIFSKHSHTSYTLKRYLEIHPTYTKGEDKRYIRNGDIIAALLLKGLRAKYVCDGTRSVNLRFNIKNKKGGSLKPTNLAPIHYIYTPKYFGNKRVAVIHCFQRKCVKCHRGKEVNHLMLNQKGKRGGYIIVFKCDKCGVVWYYFTETLPIDSTKGFQIIILCDVKM